MQKLKVLSSNQGTFLQFVTSIISLFFPEKTDRILSKLFNIYLLAKQAITFLVLFLKAVLQTQLS